MNSKSFNKINILKANWFLIALLFGLAAVYALNLNGSAAGAADGGGAASTTGEQQTEVKLPGEITDVAVGGGGRFLILHLQKLGQLAIFDTKAAKVVKYLSVDSDNICFTASAEKLIVVAVAQNTISRYSLKTFEKETTTPMPIKGPIKAIIMGANSHGPMLVLAATGAGLYVINPTTLAILGTNVKAVLAGFPQIRASADGKVFGMWRPQVSLSGLRILIVEGSNVQESYLPRNVGTVVPGPDGRVIFTTNGLYTVKTDKPELIGTPQPYSKPILRMPATQGNYYLDIDEKGMIAVCVVGEPDPIATFPKIDDLRAGDGSLYPRGDEPFTPDKRFHLIPDAHLIIAIPKTNDRLILQQVNLLKSVKDAKGDYLLVTSSPITSATKNSSYVYQIQVESKRGGAKFSLESGPKGMTISPSGKLTWKANTKANEVDVIVKITDASGQEIFHTFRINIQ
jgi:hypothetical protein